MFIDDPKITLLDNSAKIHFLISGSLTHIIEENCVEETNICDRANITIPSKNKHIWLLQQNSVTFDFIVEVPLADSEATAFVFSFWMYDGDDLLHSDPDIVPVNKDIGKT